MHVLLGNLKIPFNIERVLEENTDQGGKTYFNKPKLSLLNALCDKYGTDKGEVAVDGHPYPWVSHSYADFYETRFGHCRHAITTVFECGLGSFRADLPWNMGAQGRPGASLRVWRDYFPNARIFGADIDAEALFQEDRISTHRVDQTSPAAIAAMWDAIPVEAFDLIIDDGLHQFDAGVCLFENSFHKLRPGGLYIIEDVGAEAMTRFITYFHDFPHKVEFVCLDRKARKADDDRLVVITKQG